jgi:hypothetical protein
VDFDRGSIRAKLFPSIATVRSVVIARKGNGKDAMRLDVCASESIRLDPVVDPESRIRLMGRKSSEG